MLTLKSLKSRTYSGLLTSISRILYLKCFCALNRTTWSEKRKKKEWTYLCSIEPKTISSPSLISWLLKYRRSATSTGSTIHCRNVLRIRPRSNTSNIGWCCSKKKNTSERAHVKFRNYRPIELQILLSRRWICIWSTREKEKQPTIWQLHLIENCSSRRFTKLWN